MAGSTLTRPPELPALSQLPMPSRHASVPLATTPEAYRPNPAPLAPVTGPRHALANLPTNPEFPTDWVHGLAKPERQRFTELAHRSNMPYPALAQALTADGAMRQRFTPGNTSATPPNYSDVFDFYRQMPQEYQNSLRDYQAWQMLQHGEANSGRPPTPAVPWVFHPTADAPNAGDANTLQAPEHYENLRDFAGLHNVDVANPQFRQWWSQQQGNWADPAQRHAGGVPGLIESYASRTRQQQAQREHNQIEGERTPVTVDPLFGLAEGNPLAMNVPGASYSTADAQRLAGMRRTDEATGREFVVARPSAAPTTVGGDIGGVLRTMASGAALPFAGAADVYNRVTGASDSWDNTQMAARSATEYAQSLAGLDVGHATASRPASFRPGGHLADVAIGPDAGRGLFGTAGVATPTTDRRVRRESGNVETPSQFGAISQPGGLPAFAQGYRQRAADPAANWASRAGYTAAGEVANNAETLLGLAVPFGAIGRIPAVARRAPGLAPALHGINAFSNVGMPALDAAAAPIREIPTGTTGHNVGDTFDDLRTRAQLSGRDADAPWWQRLAGNAADTGLNYLPGMGGAGAVGYGGTRVPGLTHVPGAGPVLARARQFASPRGLLPWLAGAQTLANTTHPEPLAPEARRQMTESIGQAAPTRRHNAWMDYWLQQNENYRRQYGHNDPAVVARLQPYLGAQNAQGQ